MVTAVGAPRIIPNTNSRVSRHLNNQSSDFSSPNSLARAVLNSENPLSVVFNNLSKKYNFPFSDLPSSLNESFKVLKNI